MSELPKPIVIQPIADTSAEEDNYGGYADSTVDGNLSAMHDHTDAMQHQGRIEKIKEHNL